MDQHESSPFTRPPTRTPACALMAAIFVLGACQTTPQRDPGPEATSLKPTPALRATPVATAATVVEAAPVAKTTVKTTLVAKAEAVKATPSIPNSSFPRACAVISQSISIVGEKESTAALEDYILAATAKFDAVRPEQVAVDSPPTLIAPSLASYQRHVLAPPTLHRGQAPASAKLRADGNFVVDRIIFSLRPDGRLREAFVYEASPKAVGVTRYRYQYDCKLTNCWNLCTTAINCTLLTPDHSNSCNDACAATEDAPAAQEALSCLLDTRSCTAIKGCDGYEFVLGTML